MHTLRVATTLFLGALGLPAHAAPQCDIRGEVSRVVDGDTLHLAETPQAEPVKIRLADIDTPERNQPYGREATKLLASLAYGRDLCLTVITKDRYGRTVAHLYDGGNWINRELVAEGAAWVYRKYAKPPYGQPLLDAEEVACGSASRHPQKWRCTAKKYTSASSLANCGRRAMTGHPQINNGQDASTAEGRKKGPGQASIESPGGASAVPHGTRRARGPGS